MTRETAQTPRGLPAPLPEGEHILWQGSPDWKALALRAMRLRGIGIYFGLLAVATALLAIGDGASLGTALVAGSWLIAIGAVVIAMFTFYAWLAARAAIYTITNRRVILSFGVAMPMSMNVPYGLISSAALKVHADGTGDLPLVVNAQKRLSFVLLWPHVRPWHFTRVEPMIRCVPRAAEVAAILADALRAVQTSSSAVPTATERAPREAALAPAASQRGDHRGGAQSPVAA